MARFIYQWLVLLHPAYFRKRFADEMLWIFDQERGVRAKLVMFADAVSSLVRQWLLRPREQPPVVAGYVLFSSYVPIESKLPRGAAASGAVLTIVLFGLLTLAFRPSPLSGTRLTSWYGFGERIASGTEHRDSLPNKPRSRRINLILANTLSYFESIKILTAIDSNHDGYLSRDEIAKAPGALLQLSVGDRLTANECGFRIGVMRVIASPQKYVTAIMKYDANHDGKLDEYELPNGMKGLVKEADTNGDFLLSPAEIRAFAMSPEQSNSRRIARQRQSIHMRFHPALVALDSNQDEVIDAEEIRNAATSLLKLDKNHDGRLSPEEVLPDPVEYIIHELRHYDVNADGRFDADELKTARSMGGAFFRGVLEAGLDMLKYASTIEVEDLKPEIRRRADLNKDGVVTWDELVKAEHNNAFASFQLSDAPLPRQPRSK